MDFYGDYIDEDWLIEVPFEFCNDPFPLVLLTEHQTGCRPDLVRVVEPTIEDVEAEFINMDNSVHKKSNESDDDNISQKEKNSPIKVASAPKQVQIISQQETISPKKTKQKSNNNTREKFPVDEYEVLGDDILQESKTFAFGSTKDEKRAEEEKPSFKAPPNYTLSDSKQFIHNDLTESDNEDGESIEDFWKRADIKLSQKLRMLEKKKD